MVAVILADLNETESQLWQAFPHGTWVDLRAGDAAIDDLGSARCWGPDRIIRAAVITALLLGAGEVEPGYAPAVRLRGARISGRLDLMGATLSYPLVCEHCYFDEELRFVESSTRTVRFISSYLPALNGTRMRLDGILNLWASEIAGVLRLEQAKLSGQLCLHDTTIGMGSGTEAVAAYGLAVDSGLECAGLNAHGSVGMETASITGSVDLSGARITCPGHRGLIMDRAVTGRLDCRGMMVEGEMSMHNSRIGASMLLSAARLDNPGGVALSGGGLNVAGGVFLDNGFVAIGEIRLYGANFAANLTIPGGTLSNPGGIALNLDRATIGSFHGADLAAEGQISLISARIASDIDLSIDAEREPAQIADKRLAYARCLASLPRVVFTAAKLGNYSDGVNAEERRSLALALHESLAPMVVATNEMRLIAPESLGELADEVARKVALAAGDIERGIDTDFVFAPLREQLYQTMRADLEGRASIVPISHR